MLLGELGRYPVEIVVQTKMISFWVRLLLGKQSKISYILYQYMLHNSNQNFKWLNKIKEILNSVGRTDLWISQNSLLNKSTPSRIKMTLIDQYKQTWHDQMQLSNKGRIYKSFKTSHTYERYFNILPRRNFITLFKFRTCNTRLPSETGRYEGIDFLDRLCPLCNTGSPGTERHYIFNCSYFNNQRNIYLRNSFKLIDNDNNFSHIMNANNEKKSHLPMQIYPLYINEVLNY